MLILHKLVFSILKNTHCPLVISKIQANLTKRVPLDCVRGWPFGWNVSRDDNK